MYALGVLVVLVCLVVIFTIKDDKGDKLILKPYIKTPLGVLVGVVGILYLTHIADKFNWF